MKITKKSRKNKPHKLIFFLWVSVLWCDIMTLGQNDWSWRAMALRFLCMGIACIFAGILMLGGGIVTGQPSAWIAGAIALGFGLFAFCIGLLYRS